MALGELNLTNLLLPWRRSLAAGVSSVFGRSGTVVAEADDYAASQVTNDSTVTGPQVSDALDTLKNSISPIFALGGTYAARPAPIPGPDFGTCYRYTTSDGPLEFINVGGLWQPMIDGVTGSEVPPVASWGGSFDGIGGGFQYVGGALTLNAGPIGAPASRGLIFPLVPGFSVATCHVKLSMLFADPDPVGVLSCAAGLCVRDSVSGVIKMALITALVDSTNPSAPIFKVGVYSALNENSAPAQTGTTQAVPYRGEAWFRIDESSGVVRVYQYSIDGYVWVGLLVEPLGDASDQIGIIGTVISNVGIESCWDSFQLTA